MSTEREYYERYWTDIDAAPPSNDPTTPTRQALLKSALDGIPAGSHVLDLGCGTGEFTAYLASLGYTPTGIELSEKAVEVARARHPNFDFRVGTPDQHAAEFARRFAAVWSSEVIEHVFDVYGFLVSAHACLAPGGRLVLTTPYHGLIKNLLIDLGGYANHYKPFAGHIRFFDRKSLGACLQHCGFTPRKWSGYGRPWPLYKSFFVVAEKTHAVGVPPPADG